MIGAIRQEVLSGPALAITSLYAILNLTYSLKYQTARDMPPDDGNSTVVSRSTTTALFRTIIINNSIKPSIKKPALSWFFYLITQRNQLNINVKLALVGCFLSQVSD
jgi:hypothetical protein